MNTTTETLARRILSLWLRLSGGLDRLQPLALLLARLYVARVFFLSGLTKISDWETTLLLFSEDYHVPLLSPVLAALLGTAGELILPVMLVLGVGGRFAALGLTVVNAVAVASLADIAPVAQQQHILWAVLLAALAVLGPGRWSLDHVLWPRWRTRAIAVGAVTTS